MNSLRGAQRKSQGRGGRGTWWAAVYGVAQSRTRLKRFSKQQQRKSDSRNISSTFKFSGNEVATVTSQMQQTVQG